MNDLNPEVPGEHEALLQFLYMVPIGLVQMSIEGEIALINPRAAQLLLPLSLGSSLDHFFALTDPLAPQLRQGVAAFAQPWGIVCESMRIPVELRGRDKAQPQFLSISLLKLDATRLMAVVGDATLDVARERQDLVSRLSLAAHTDHLTQIPNRAAVYERLQQALSVAPGEPGHAFAVLFISCMRFAQINDSLGYAAGDEVLALMAQRLRSTLRPQDCVDHADENGQMAARIGSDEFVVVLDDLPHRDDVHAVANRLMDSLAQPYAVRGHQVHCQVSMGILLREQAQGDADAVLRDASIAMFEARRTAGTQYVVFEHAMRDHATRRWALATDLRGALAKDQLFVVYQPVVGLEPDGSIDRSRGVEALVRWQHPTRGTVSPLEFIGIAEECGLIGAIGDFVLRTACRDFSRWQSLLGERAPRLMAVNLSRAQLGEAGWEEKVIQILQSNQMDPQQLQLEVTESLAAQDETVQARLHAIKAMGIKLALDDFGTGYSSLSSLHLLPVDTVKIDRTFVGPAEHSRHHQALIEATIRVAQSLGMGTVAEGIETEAQSEVLRGLGCKKGQGYLFSRPLSAPDLLQWLVAESP